MIGASSGERDLTPLDDKRVSLASMARRGSGIEILAAACAAIVALASAAVVTARSHPPTALAATAAPTAIPTPFVPTPAPVAGTPIGAVTTTRAVAVRTKATDTAPATSTIRAGIFLPVLARAGRFVQVMTPCERTGFVPLASTDAIPQERAPAKRVTQATIVVDPGHGGTESGATGPHGLKESVVNLDIAKRVVDRLPGARVFLTRSGDYMAGLAFRTAIANSLHADAFVSVHNNAQPDGPSTKPGTETYYQITSSGSKRLAGLSYEELLPSLERFKAKWVSDKDAGAKYRSNAAGLDYYGVLRRSHIPAVITESLYISNAPEEALLGQPATREAIADALGRAIDRYLTTADPGSGFVTPLLKNEGSTFVLPPTCHDPS